jgi:hypothetical protein
MNKPAQVSEPPKQVPALAPASQPEIKTPPTSVKVPTPLPYSVELKPLRPLTVNSPSNMELRILNSSGQPVKHKNFKVTHGQRIHTLIIDPSLTDYQHIHMRPDDFNSQALYEFTLLPRQAGDYKLTVDVVDQKNKQYFLETTFNVPGTAKTPSFDPKLAKGSMQETAQAEGLTFTALVDGPIRAKQHVMLNITVKKNDELFRKLEPTMQAYAHLIGFNADRSKLMHAHPMGEEPRSNNQRGGPNLKFGLEFPTPGKYRVFLQVRVAGKDIFVPFDVSVIQ